MKKLQLIAVLVSALVEISTSVSLYSIISNAEHVAHDNRLPKKLQPVELMVDATNHLGFKILNLHSNLNKNNVAFSPCGLMSVLVALYEGSSSRSTIELKESLQFPNERDVVRVGVRDIHRRLRVSTIASNVTLILLLFDSFVPTTWCLTTRKKKQANN
jgi:serine protease inhibitor